MPVILYRFDSTEDFPLLESDTTARGPVTVRVEGRSPDACLRLAWERQHDDPPVVTVVLALPPLAVDGEPEKLLLDVLGDASGCHLSLEAGDAQGWGFAYSFGKVDFTGWRTCAARVKEPSEYWGSRQQDPAPGVVPPVQPYQLTFVMSESCQAFDIGLRALSVTGDVRLAPPGIAGTDVPDMDVNA